MKRLRDICIAASAVLFLGGCEPGAGAAALEDVPEEERYGGTAVIGGIGDLQTMNALVMSDYTSGMIAREMLFMPLMKYDEDLVPQPWLAERWDTTWVAADTIELTFHLRDDVYWHDGEPTTARDVAFTFERAIDPETAFPNAQNFANWDPNVEVLDDHTVRFRLRSHADFLDMWYQTPAMPEHILGDVPPVELINHPFGTREPVGNGPYRFLRRVPGQEWVFEANDDFTDALGGRPYLDRIVYRSIPEQTTLMTELMRGGVDMYLQPLPEQAQRLDGERGIEIRSAPFRQWTYLAFNTRNPLFEDARVRRAIGMAIDREQILDALLYGYGEIGRASSTPGHWSYDPDDQETLLPFDQDRARELLAQAGWQDRQGDGILRNEAGEPFRFTLITNHGNELRSEIQQIIQAQLRRVGIDVRLRSVEWNTMIRQLQGSVGADGVREREFDAVIGAWVNYFRQDDKGLLHSENLNGPYQYVGWSHPRADELIDSTVVEIDREAAQPLWQEYQRLFVQESPYLVLHYPERIMGLRQRLRNVEFDTRGEMVNIAAWWIHPQERRGGDRPRPAAGPAAEDTLPGDG